MLADFPPLLVWPPCLSNVQALQSHSGKGPFEKLEDRKD